MKKCIFILLLFIIIIFPKITFAENLTSLDDTIKEQEASFGIKEFLKNIEKYNISENANDLNINEMFNNAVSR